MEEPSEITDFVDYSIVGNKKKLSLNGISFVAGYLQVLIKSPGFSDVSRTFQERIRHLSYLVHLLCRYDDFGFMLKEYKIVQADLEDNVTNWEDYEYFRRWEHKVMGKFKSEDADHTYNELPEYNDEDEEEEDVKQEFDVKHDPEYKPKTIKFQKKNGKKGVRKTKKASGKCKVCKKVVKKLESHVKNVHSDKAYPCSDCDYVGKMAYDTKKHVIRMHDGEKKKTIRKPRTSSMKVFQCKDCDFSCALEKKLKEHEFSKHGKPLDCESCHVSFQDVESYTKHVRNHTVTCNVCGKSILEIGIQRHMEYMHGETSEKFEVCSICGLSLKASGMNQHIKKVHNYNMHSCPHCQYIAKTSYDLNRHIKRKHEEANVVNCPWCGRLTKDLDRHLKNNQCNIPEHERTNNNPQYACEHCNKTFKKEVALVRHFKIVHEKIKDFQCDQCNYKTSTGFNLRIHVKRVHERKPLKEMCPHCDKAFIQLDWHIQTYHGELVNHREPLIQ